MKKIICFLTMVLLFSCSSNENKIVTGAENYLKTILKDPKSYERIDYKFEDTTMLKSKLSYDYSVDTIHLSADRSYRQEDIAKDSLSAIADKNKLDNLKVDSIYSISIKFNYRAKNGMGGLDIFNSVIKYFPTTNTFEAEEKK